MKENIKIIGAGIAGLTTALTFIKMGKEVTLFEKSDELKPVGAGILLANNAMQVYKKMGLDEKIEKAGNKITMMKITNSQLKPLSIVDLCEYEKKYNVSAVAISRGELLKILIEAVGNSNINLSKKLLKIEKNDLYKLTFEDNTSIETKWFLGADGINSNVRQQLFSKSTLRNSNQNCWRGVCNFQLPEKYNNELIEAWGTGRRFGFIKINTHQVYWYALTNRSISMEKGLMKLFDNFHPVILKLLAKTNENKIFKSEIMDLKPIKAWQKDNVCLIGDAAHATTPNLGQGAGQAVEDAYVLGQLLYKSELVEDIFAKYEAIRKKKAQRIIKTSWIMGKLSQLENPIGIFVRNFIMINTPKSITKKQMNEIYTLPII